MNLHLGRHRLSWQTLQRKMYQKQKRNWKSRKISNQKRHRSPLVAGLISRPDLNCAVHKCAIWQNKPSEKLWKSLMTILRYLKHTKHFGIIFTRPKSNFDMTHNFLLKCFSDASFASEPGSKSRVGYFYFVLNCLVSWTSHHSTRVMSSSTEAECHALVHVGKENTWMREFLSKLNYFHWDFSSNNLPR